MYKFTIYLPHCTKKMGTRYLLTILIRKFRNNVSLEIVLEDILKFIYHLYIIAMKHRHTFFQVFGYVH